MLTLNRATLLVLLVLFTLAGATAGYFTAAWRAKVELEGYFYRNSSLSARSMALALSQLSTNDSRKATQVLESNLAMELATLSFYEKNVPPNRRDERVYVDIAKVREYYGNFPIARSSPVVAAGLALSAPKPNAP